MSTVFRRSVPWRQSCGTNCSTSRTRLSAGIWLRQWYFASSILQVSRQSKSAPLINKATPKAKSQIPPARPPMGGSATIYQPFAATLARKPHPTTLYQAPSHTLFIVSSYGTALLCFAYAGFNFYTNYVQAPEGLAPWVPLAFIGVCSTASALGIWILLAPTSLVRTITAIPKASPSTRITARISQTRIPEPQLTIEIELRKLLPIPFLRNRKIYAAPKDLVLRRPLAPSDLRLTAEQARLRQEDEEEDKAKYLEYERTHIMSAPFRHAGRAFSNFFRALGRSFFREGFEKLDVKGKTLKIDATGGWALDSGKALDRLATVKSPF